MAKGANSVIYIQRSGLTYISGATTSQLPFSPDIVSYFDIVNEEVFSTKLTEFITKNKLVPANIAMVFGPDTLFEKEFPLGAKSELPEDAIKQFIDTVPFENTGHVTIKSAKSALVAATNADMYEITKKIFTKQSFEVIAATPFNTISPDPKYFAQFSSSLASTLLQKFDTLRQNNLLQKSSTSQAPLTAIMQKQIGKEGKKSDNKRIFLLVGMFGILLIVMVVMFLNMQKQNSQNKNIASPTPLPPLFSPTPIPSITEKPATTSASITPVLTIPTGTQKTR